MPGVFPGDETAGPHIPVRPGLQHDIPCMPCMTGALQGHPVCEPCKARPEVRHCPTCRQRIVGRATLVEKIAVQVLPPAACPLGCSDLSRCSPVRTRSRPGGERNSSRLPPSAPPCRAPSGIDSRVQSIMTDRHVSQLPRHLPRLLPRALLPAPPPHLLPLTQEWNKDRQRRLQVRLFPTKYGHHH